MTYDFEKLTKVKVSGIDLRSLNEEETSVLYTAARYCQAMCDADLDTMREIVSPDKIFTHMSGRQQTREEYFHDIAVGNLKYFTIGMDGTTVSVQGNQAVVSYTSVLNANAYGARGTFHMKGKHYFRKIQERWVQVNG